MLGALGLRGHDRLGAVTGGGVYHLHLPAPCCPGPAVASPSLFLPLPPHVAPTGSSSRPLRCSRPHFCRFCCWASSPGGRRPHSEAPPSSALPRLPSSPSGPPTPPVFSFACRPASPQGNSPLGPVRASARQPLAPAPFPTGLPAEGTPPSPVSTTSEAASADGACLSPGGPPQEWAQGGAQPVHQPPEQRAPRLQTFLLARWTRQTVKSFTVFYFLATQQETRHDRWKPCP